MFFLFTNTRYTKLFYALLFFIGFYKMGYAYTPITWLEPFPQNFFAQPCVSNIQEKEEIYASWQGDIQTNLFAVGPDGGYGLAMEGGLRRDDILHGIFGRIYIPVGFAYEQRKYIAELSLLGGLSVIKRKSFGFDVYALAKIPQAIHSVSHNNFSGGFGCSCFIRIFGKPKHHLDCLTEVDVLFHAPYTWRWGGSTYHSKDHASYKIQSALAYRFKHFVSDLGWRCDGHNQYWNAGTLFADVGWLMRCGKFPSYLTLGVGLVGVSVPYCCPAGSCAPLTQLKFGVNF